MRHSPSPCCPSFGQGARARCSLAVGPGLRLWTRHLPFGVRTLRGLARRRGGGRLPQGGPSHRCEGRLVSGALALQAACPWGRSEV